MNISFENYYSDFYTIIREILKCNCNCNYICDCDCNSSIAYCIEYGIKWEKYVLNNIATAPQTIMINDVDHK